MGDIIREGWEERMRHGITMDKVPAQIRYDWEQALIEIRKLRSDLSECEAELIELKNKEGV